MFKLFNRAPPPKTFDDVASDEIKAVRAKINVAARETMWRAARFAQDGRVEEASECWMHAEKLSWQAINIPLALIKYQDIK